MTDNQLGPSPIPAGPRRDRRGRIRKTDKVMPRAWSRQRLSDSDAAQEMKDAGYDPCGPYPGTRVGWLVVCTRCYQTRTISLRSVRLGHRCQSCIHLGLLPTYLTDAGTDEVAA